MNYLPPKTPSRLPAFPFASKVSDLSKQSGSTSSSKHSVSTPSSVRVGSIVSKSELSDLTGSYRNGDKSKSSIGSPPGQPAGIPSHIYPSDASNTSLQRSWCQAYILSTPILINDPISTYKLSEADNSNGKNHIYVEGEGNVEIVRQEKKDKECAATTMPLILLCMDPFRKRYEILKIRIDSQQDTVRDILGSMKRNISENVNWRQDYDGLIHLKESKVSQLIHCLGVHNYDVQPFEVWIAKPWSLSATVTAHYGVSLLEHLLDIGIVTRAGTSFRLSTVAQSRIYSPVEIINHHHAQQYLVFSPPFEHMPLVSSQQSVTGPIDDQFSFDTCGRLALHHNQEAIETVPASCNRENKYTCSSNHSSNDECQGKPSLTLFSRRIKEESSILHEEQQNDESETCLLQDATTEKWRQYAANSKVRKEMQAGSTSPEDEQRLRNLIGCMSKFLCQGRTINHHSYSKLDSRQNASQTMEDPSLASGNISSISGGKPSLDFGTLEMSEDASFVSINSSNAHRSDVPLLHSHNHAVDKVFPRRRN